MKRTEGILFFGLKFTFFIVNELPILGEQGLYN
mgnify:FL=1|jgi:hypothetical protein